MITSQTLLKQHSFAKILNEKKQKKQFDLLEAFKISPRKWDTNFFAISYGTFWMLHLNLLLVFHDYQLLTVFILLLIPGYTANFFNHYHHAIRVNVFKGFCRSSGSRIIVWYA